MREKISAIEVLPYPSIFGSLATLEEEFEDELVDCCHTLLFSGHLQLNDLPCGTIRGWLPYPSIFGSLATGRLGRCSIPG